MELRVVEWWDGSVDDDDDGKGGVWREGRENIDVRNICDFRKVEGNLHHQEACSYHVAMATQIRISC